MGVVDQHVANLMFVGVAKLCYQRSIMAGQGHGRDEGPLVREVTMTVLCPRGQEEDYGFELDGAHWPVRVRRIVKGSPAGLAGMRQGDFFLMLNGHDVLQAPLAQVQAVVSYSAGAALTVKVARVAGHKGSMIALDAVRRKYKGPDAGLVERAAGLTAYQQALGSAVQSAFDILGPQRGGAGSEQEVILSLGDGGDDSSPPCSSQEDSSDLDYDPLLDFSHGSNEFCVPSGPADSSAALVGNVIRAQQALKEMCNISLGVAREGSQNRLVSTEASMMVSMDSGRDAEKWSANRSATNLPPHTSCHSSDRPGADPEPQTLLVDNPATDMDSNADPPHTSLHKPASSSHSGSSPLPPPVPPYQPGTPDNFLLSNKPEYQLEFKKQRHLYEEVQFPPATETELPLFLSTKMKARNRVKEAASMSASHHSCPEKGESCLGGTGGGVDPIRASKGLPASVYNWRQEHVLRWLRQLNPLFSELYAQCFSDHCVTGHTLLHLNQSKLQIMGVASKDHWTQMGMAIARLRLYHEQKELEKLSHELSWV